MKVPLFNSALFRNNIISLGGGGGKRVGLQNFIFIFDKESLKEKQRLELESIYDKV